MPPRTQQRTAFSLGDKTVVVESPHVRLLRRIEALFPEYVADSPECAATTFTVDRKRLRWQLETHKSEAAPQSFATQSALVDELEFALTLELLSSRPRAGYIHGSAVQVEGQGAVLALGASGAGKSSLALKWSVDGHPVFGDDLIRLEAGGKISAFKRLFEVDRGRIDELGVECPTCPQWAPRSSEIWFDPRAFGGWATGAHDVSVVALVERQDEVGFHTEEVGKEEMLGWLSASMMPQGLPVADCLDDLIAMVNGARCCKVSFHDSSRAADQLVRSLT